MYTTFLFLVRFTFCYMNWCYMYISTSWSIFLMSFECLKSSMNYVLMISYHNFLWWLVFEPPHDKTNKMACAPSKDSDQPGHPPSLIRVFAVRMKKAWVLSYPLSAQWRHWSDWVDAQADLSISWVHRGFCRVCPEAAHLFKVVFVWLKSLMSSLSVP